MAPRVVTSGSSWVEPAGPVVPKIIQCSAVENQCAQVYPTVMWLFETNEKSKSGMAQYALLKKGLARVLYQQPILGGMLEQDERGAYSVNIGPVPRSGARFHYQDLTSDTNFPTYQELKQRQFPIIDGKHDGLSALHPADYPTSQDGDPTFLGQLTVLRGGMAVSASWTHLIGDLVNPRVSATHWAEQTKIISEAEAAGLPEPALPDIFPDILYDRSRLIPHIPHLLSFEEVHEACEKRGDMFVFDPTSPERTSELMQTVFPAAYLKPSEEQDESAMRTENGGMMHFSMKELQKLQALAQTGSDKKLSTVATVIGFMWQRFYVAKFALDGEPSEELKKRGSSPAIIFPGDIRNRLNPPLPTGYLGAAVDMIKASLPQKALLPENGSDAALGRSVGACASSVRDANDGWSEDWYMDLLRLWSSTPVIVPFLPKGPLDFLVTDHTRNAPLRLIDWGLGLGKCSDLRQPYFGRDYPQGEITIMPRLPNGDIQVMITAEQVLMDRLYNDPVLLQFAQPLYMGYNVPEAVAAKKAAEFTPSARL